MKTFIQKLGKSLMGPLSIIVAAGLLLGLASTLLNPNVFGNALANVGFVNDFVSLINALAGGLFGLLPILFCMSVAQGMSREGAFGTFIYGFLERLLIPTGLHHILNQLIRFTPIGGSAMIDGQQVSGALNIFNTLLMQAEPDMDVMRQATRFLTQGTHPFMVFGLPAACYAMYKTALPKNKQKVKGILLAAGLTSLFTGITEPIEFSFFFISPLLWLFHAFMAGMSFLINTLLGVCIGNAGGGLIDLMLFGVLRGPQTKWLLNVVIGLIYAVIYFFVFKWAIVKFNIKTPGREDETDEVVDTDEVTELGNGIMDALGGKENIVEIDNCISRLRLVLKDTSIVNNALLKKTGSLGIIKINENNIQVVYGTKVEKAAAELKRAVKNSK